MLSFPVQQEHTKKQFKTVYNETQFEYLICPWLLRPSSWVIVPALCQTHDFANAFSPLSMSARKGHCCIPRLFSRRSLKVIVLIRARRTSFSFFCFSFVGWLFWENTCVRQPKSAPLCNICFLFYFLASGNEA